MFKKSLLLMLLMAVFAPWAANAQTTVEIGDGTVTCNTNPIGTYYNYSITEQLYTAEEIGMAGTISSISFYYQGTAAKDLPITVYMKHVDEGDLASGGISLADAEEVFTGTLSVTTTAGWVTIELDTPFAYDGTSNLLIGCIKGYLYYFSGQTWQGTATSSTMARYTQNDNNEYTTSTVPGTAQTNRPNIQLVITAGSGSVCEKPETFEVSNVTANSATLTWTGGSGTYNVEYKGGSAADWTAYLTNTTSTSANLTGLTPSTAYQYRVQSVCGSDVSGWKNVSFTTECEVLTNFPITYGFETSEGFPTNASTPTSNQFGPCWRNEATVQTGSNSNRVWGTSTSSKHTGSQALILPDKGNSSNPAKTMLVFPEMNFTDANGYVVSFWIQRSGSSSNPEGFKVYASDCDTIGPNAVELGHYSRNYGIAYPVVEPTSGWYQYETEPITMTGSVHIIFEGHSYYGNATYVDDIEIKVAPSCFKPTGLAASNVTAHEATINWTSEATAWQIQLNDEDAIDVTEAPYTFTGLTPETTYSVKVRTNCGGIYSDWTNPVSFTTGIACPAPTVAVSNVTAFTAEVSCTNTDAEIFNVMLDEEVIAENVAMPYTLTELTDNTSYTVKVQAICGGEDGESEWSSGTSFMTAEICPEGMVCIGAGTNTSVYVPAYNYYKYSYSQQIYTADEIGMAGEITSIEFKNTGAEKTLTCNVYMTATDKTAFANTSDWVALSDGDLVFSGSITFTAAGEWTTIEFENPFNYDGTSNLLVTVANVTGSYSNQPHMSCLTFPATNQALYVYTDDGAYNIAAPGVSGTRPAFKNRIRMAIGEPPACPKPTGLAVNYTGGTTATVTWEGTATSYNIDVNGTVIEGVTSPYTLEGLELATTYTVMVQANCGEDLSDWTNAASFTTDLCMPENQCELTFVLTDSYGDGWNGAYIDVVDVATGESLAHMSNQNLSKGDPETETYTLTVCDGRELQFVWVSGSYDSEASYVVTDINGEEIFSGSGAMSEPVNYTVNCTVNPCRVPTDLAASEISTFKADLSWTGYHDAYNLQYRRPAAADPNATTATVILTAGDVWGDGSGYQMLLDADATAYGTIIPEIGSYGYISADGTIGGSTGDVSSSVYDEFEYKIPVNADGALATENIVINNSITIAIPAGVYDWCITNPTSGNNGRMWIASNNGNVGGRYDDFVFEAGMTYEFTVSMHGENDGVEVTITPMDEWILVENLTDPSYNLTGLDAKTMYEWQVQGISDDCENGVTEWSAISSFFTDKAYYWNDPQTWTNDSVPAAYEDVTIPANTEVIIPSGYTAYADEITIEEGGQIIIEPGGQLFHSNEIPVTVQMQNNGYSTAKDDNVGGFHLIASPVSPSVEISTTGLVSDEFIYDLYYFDQAGDEEGNEWINYNQGEGNAPGFTELYIQKGYLYASENTIQAEFVGSTLPTNADVSVALDYVAGKRLAGWNLVGNPFTCTAYTDRPFYALDPTGSALASVEGNSVEVMEGIFVRAFGESEFVTFSTVDVDAGGDLGGDPLEPDKGNLVLNLSHNNALVDRAIIRFDEGHQLPKLQLNPNSTEVYIPMDGVDYAIVNATEMGEMPVSFKAERNDTYTLSFAAEKVSFNYLHLVDNMTGADVDLLVNPSYSFEAKTTDYASRFKLVFATGDNSNDNNFAFFSNGNFVINNDGEATLQVVDVMGRIIKSETINGSASVSVNVATGVYMLRLINGNDVKVQKVVVR